jgi:hypothetical protein
VGSTFISAGRLDAHESTRVSVPLNLSVLSAPGNYTVLGSIDPANQVAERNEANNTLTVPGSLNVAWSFGQVPGHNRNGSLSLTDADGSRVQFSLNGPGRGEVTRTGNAFEITLNGTNSSSAVNVSVRGGDRRAQIDKLIVNGALRAFDAPDVDLSGTLQIGGVASSNGGVHITAGHVNDLTLTSSIGIAFLEIIDWHDSNGNDRISAPWIGGISTRGDFAPSLALSGGGPTYTLNGVEIGGVISGDNWNTQGRANEITAQRVTANWLGSFTGGLQSLTTRGDFNGTLATPSLERIRVGGGLSNARIYIGANLGSDGKFGGSGTATDTYRSAVLERLRVSGNISNSRVLVGVDPKNGVFGDGDDVVVPGSQILRLVVGGTISNDSRIVTSRFPATVRVNGSTRIPSSLPALSTFNPDTAAPTLTAALTNDTGVSTNDSITKDASISGAITEAGTITVLRVKLDAAANFTDITARLQPNKTFTLDLAALDAIAGGTLTDGGQVLHLQTTDGGENIGGFDLTFTFDTTAPGAPGFDLAAASDTGVLGDHQTTPATVTLAGTAEANATVKLIQTGAETVASSSGAFQFDGVALALGANTFSVSATDRAGNSTDFARI